MPWYVFALVDRRPDGRLGRGLAGALGARRVPGGFAVVERRADVPPVELGTLKQHDAVLSRVAATVPAILPVRFGTLLEMDEIEDALDEREEDVAEAFDRVRGRVQFTWRRTRGQGLAANARRAKVAARGTSGVMSGAEYLRRIAAKPEMPAAFRAIGAKLRPLVAAERYHPGTASLPDSLYHLVGGADANRYRAAAKPLASANPAVRMSGPFAPFAFTPDLL
jgi:hypothetical protein